MRNSTYEKIVVILFLVFGTSCSHHDKKTKRYPSSEDKTTIYQDEDMTTYEGRAAEKLFNFLKNKAGFVGNENIHTKGLIFEGFAISCDKLGSCGFDFGRGAFLNHLEQESQNELKVIITNDFKLPFPIYFDVESCLEDNSESSKNPRYECLLKIDVKE